MGNKTSKKSKKTQVDRQTPKRLFHVPSMSTVMYKDVVDDVKKKGYVAISHVWGEQIMYSADEFDIKGVNWKIPLSDPNKIPRMRTAMIRYKMEYCWFDVLCMPQDKQNEINLEISFMGDYYEGAETTFILSDKEYVLNKDFLIWYYMMKDIMEKKREFTKEEDNWIESHKKGDLLDISEEPWFERVWTFQEDVLSVEIFLIDVKGLDIGLTSIAHMVIHMHKINMSYRTLLFFKSMHNIQTLHLYDDMKRFGTFPLVTSRPIRKCYKRHDQFYGMLGVLRYRDFPVDYDISIKNLNKKIIQYAYSKGDISWIAICGDEGFSFIQPPGKGLSKIGNGWKEEEPESCNIRFRDNNLYMNVFPLATVIYSELFSNLMDYNKEYYHMEDSGTKLYRMLRNMGFDDDCIVNTITGFANISHEIREIGRILFGRSDDDKWEDELRKISLPYRADKYFDEVNEKFLECTRTNSMMTVVIVSLNDTNEKIPLIVSGAADVGDEIKLLKLCDEHGKFLGIVCNSGKRKGVCTYKKIDAHKRFYKPYKFQL